MPTIAQLCDQLVAAYEAKSLPVATSLRPPLSSADIEHLTITAKVRLAPELVELYGWRDGTSSGSGFQFAGRAFLSLEQALARREALMAALHPKDRVDSELSELVPFAEAEPEWLALSATALNGHRPVLEVVEDTRVAFDSLAAMLSTCIGWVSEADWTSNTPPKRAQEIWFQNNRGDL